MVCEISRLKMLFWSGISRIRDGDACWALMTFRSNECKKNFKSRRTLVNCCNLVKILGASPEAFEFPDLKIEGTKQALVKILGASPEAFEFPDLKIEGTKQASGN